MKYLIYISILVFAISARAQITLEHTYTHNGGVEFGLVQVDSGLWKYVQTNISDTIAIYNLDHSLDKIIVIPFFERGNDFVVNTEIIARNLFNTDGSYGYLISSGDSVGHSLIRILQEDGKLLFSCDTCQLNQNIGFPYLRVSSIVSTDSGTKLLIQRGYPSYFQVYSLPGKLPGCQTATAAVSPSIVYEGNQVPTSAYPNPSRGRVRIAYQLPPGVASGEVVLTDEEGREVKRYHVTDAFSDLEIQESDLPSGFYFYRLVTSKGESGVQRIVCEK